MIKNKTNTVSTLRTYILHVDKTNTIACSEFTNLQNNDKLEMPPNLTSSTYYEIGLHCFNNNMSSQCEKYLKKAIECDNHVMANILLANHYSKTYKTMNKALEILNKIEINNNFTPVMIIFIGNAYIWCNKIKEFKKIVKPLLNETSMVNYGIVHQFYDINHYKMKYYYKKVITNNNDDNKKGCCALAHYKLAYHYSQTEINYKLALKHYEKAVEFGCKNSMYELGYIYDESTPHHAKFAEFGDDYKYLSNNELSMKYYKMAVEKESKHAIDALENKLPLLEFFNFLKGIENPPKMVLDKLDDLKKNPKISDMSYRIAVSEKYNFVEECVICYETKNSIMQSCCHFCCANCYIKIDKCAVCNGKHELSKNNPIAVSLTDNRQNSVADGGATVVVAEETVENSSS